VIDPTGPDRMRYRAQDPGGPVLMLNRLRCQQGLRLHTEGLPTTGLRPTAA